MKTVKSGTAIIAELKRTAQKGEPMSDLISRQDALDEFLRFSDNLDKDMLIRTYIRLNRLPSVRPEPEHTMEEFMYGQELGDPEDGSL